ncbi:hypothetical protein TRVA0_001S06590 [Trichomonascus vanleenenianus]|uniref:Fhl1p n=1 Tax=Trichomonascus vanleenenianus TaxID=2268995 RepID=UPI003ECA5A40
MSTVSPGSSEFFGRETSVPASDYTENDRETDRILNSLYEEVDASDAGLLMTPSTSKAKVDSAETEIRKPVRSRGPSPTIDHQNFPLTFAANSTNATTSNTSSNANSRHSSVSGAGINDNSANNNNDGDSTDDESRVSAYARLDFDTFTFYVQTLQVMLGRRAENGPGMVDVHLGPAKAISRRHAKIFYNFGTQRFELSVLGRNGAFVGDVFVEANSTVPLTDGARIQIGQISFTFVLPRSQNESSRRAPATTSTTSTTVSTTAQASKPKVESTKSNRATPEIPMTPITKSVTIKSEIDPELASLSADVKALEPPSSAPSPKPPAEKTVVAAPPPQKKQPKREYRPEEIPEEYREKPQHSYSYLIATALREKSPDNALTLSDIYKAIQDLFPYYKYCPHGWQNSVRHNLSSNKAFKKVSKEGKGWLWGIDEEYFLEKERQKQRAAQNAKNKAAAQARAQQQQQLAQQHAKDNAAYRAQLQAQAIERTKQQAALLAQARAESKALREQQFLKNAMKNGNLSNPISPIPPVPPSKSRSKSVTGKLGSASPPNEPEMLPESSSRASPSATLSLSPPPNATAINDPNATTSKANTPSTPPATISTNNSPATTNSNISTNQTIRSSTPPSQPATVNAVNTSASAATTKPAASSPPASVMVPSQPSSEAKSQQPLRQTSPPISAATITSDAQGGTPSGTSGSLQYKQEPKSQQQQAGGLPGHLQRHPQPQSYPHLQPDIMVKPPARKNLTKKSASPPASSTAISDVKSTTTPTTAPSKSLMPPGQTTSSGIMTKPTQPPQSHYTGGMGKAQSQSPTLRNQQPLSSLSPPLGQSYLQSVEGISRSQTVPPPPTPSSSMNKVNRAPEIHRQHLTRAPVASKVDSPKKTIAELAREIEINRSKEGSTRLYNPSYSNEDYTRKTGSSATGEKQSAPARGVISSGGGQTATRPDVSSELQKAKLPAPGSSLSSESERKTSPTLPAVVPPSSSAGYDKTPNSSAAFATRASVRAVNNSPETQPSLRPGQTTVRTAQPQTAKPAISEVQRAAAPGNVVQPRPPAPAPAPAPPTSVHTSPPAASTAAPMTTAASSSTANQVPGLNLSPEALKSLSVLRQKIQEVVGSANSSAVTQALAYAIAQAARNSGGGAQAIQEMLNGKNPAQLAQLLKNTLEKIKKSKGTTAAKQATPPPATTSSNGSTSEVVATQAPAATAPAPASTSSPPMSQSASPSQAPQASPPVPEVPAASAAPAAPVESSPAPAAASSSGNVASRLTQSPEALEAMLEKAKKIQNPSPKIKQALEQLQVQLDKLRAMRRQQQQGEQPHNNGTFASDSQGTKRPNDDESIDTTQTKVSKTM